MAWLTGYTYRKKITLSGSNGAGTGYQVLIKVGESAGSSGADIHLEGHALNFPNDIRFTAPDGETQYSYWIEYVEGTSPNRVAWIWVKVADSLDSDLDIYIYYGKAGDTSASNVVATMDKYEGFESGTFGLFSNSYTPSGTSWSVVTEKAKDGAYSLKVNDTTSSTGTYRHCNAYTFFSDYHRRIVGWLLDQNCSGGGLDFYYAYGSTFKFFLRMNTSSNVFAYTTDSAGVDTDVTYQKGQWYRFEAMLQPSAYSFTVRDAAYNVLVQVSNVTYRSMSASYSDVLCVSSNTNVGTGYFDCIWSAKYVYPEPSVQTAGSEETPAMPVAKFFSGLAMLSRRHEHSSSFETQSAVASFCSVPSIAEIAKQLQEQIDALSTVMTTRQSFPGLLSEIQDTWSALLAEMTKVVRTKVLYPGSSSRLARELSKVISELFDVSRQALQTASKLIVIAQELTTVPPTGISVANPTRVYFPYYTSISQKRRASASLSTGVGQRSLVAPTTVANSTSQSPSDLGSCAGVSKEHDVGMSYQLDVAQERSERYIRTLWSILLELKREAYKHFSALDEAARKMQKLHSTETGSRWKVEKLSSLSVQSVQKQAIELSVEVSTGLLAVFRKLLSAVVTLQHLFVQAPATLVTTEVEHVAQVIKRMKSVISKAEKLLSKVERKIQKYSDV